MNPSTSTVQITSAQTDSEFDTVFKLRAEILQKELQIPEEADIDGFDHIANHFLVYVDAKPVGTARWRMTLGRKIKLERFAVLPEFRAQGVGRLMLNHILGQVSDLGMEVFLEAHSDVVPFYERNGFVADGPSYNVSDIPHQRMVLPKG